jgi:hypothetical protein
MVHGAVGIRGLDLDWIDRGRILERAKVERNKKDAGAAVSRRLGSDGAECHDHCGFEVPFHCGAERS